MIKFKVVAQSNIADFEAKLESWVSRGWTIASFDSSGNKLTALLARDDSNDLSIKES